MKKISFLPGVASYLLLSVLVAQPSSAQLVLQPINGTASSTFGLQTLNRAYDGEGLSDSTIVDDGDAIPVTWPTHASNPTSFGFWHSDIGDTLPTVTFELSGVFTVDGVYLWNGNQPGETDRGFKKVDILASLDDILYSPVASAVAFGQGPGSDGYAGEYVPLSPFSAKYVRLQVTENWGSAVVTGISEIRFTGVPEPGTGALVFGGVVLALARRRRVVRV